MLSKERFTPSRTPAHCDMSSSKRHKRQDRITREAGSKNQRASRRTPAARASLRTCLTAHWRVAGSQAGRSGGLDPSLEQALGPLGCPPRHGLPARHAAQRLFKGRVDVFLGRDVFLDGSGRTALRPLLFLVRRRAARLRINAEEAVAHPQHVRLPLGKVFQKDDLELPVRKVLPVRAEVAPVDGLLFS